MLIVGDTYTTFKCIFITIKKLILNFKEKSKSSKNRYTYNYNIIVWNELMYL